MNPRISIGSAIVAGALAVAAPALAYTEPTVPTSRCVYGEDNLSDPIRPRPETPRFNHQLTELAANQVTPCNLSSTLLAPAPPVPKPHRR